MAEPICASCGHGASLHVNTIGDCYRSHCDCKHFAWPMQAAERLKAKRLLRGGGSDDPPSDQSRVITDPC